MSTGINTRNVTGFFFFYSYGLEMEILPWFCWSKSTCLRPFVCCVLWIVCCCVISKRFIQSLQSWESRGGRTCPQGGLASFFSHHASSNENLLDAWLWQIQTTQAHAQGKYWTHFTDAWYWCTDILLDAWLAEFAHYTHTCLARRKQLVSRKHFHTVWSIKLQGFSYPFYNT